MKRNLLAVLLLLVLAIVVQGQTAPIREHLLLDFGWRFHQGDPADAINNGADIFDYPEPGVAALAGASIAG